MSRVRENRTHGSTGGDWKRNATASPRQPPTQPSSRTAALTHYPSSVDDAVTLDAAGCVLRAHDWLLGLRNGCQPGSRMSRSSTPSPRQLSHQPATANTTPTPPADGCRSDLGRPSTAGRSARSVHQSAGRYRGCRRVGSPAEWADGDIARLRWCDPVFPHGASRGGGDHPGAVDFVESQGDQPP